MQKALKKELSFSLDTLERYRARYGRSASLDTNKEQLLPPPAAQPPLPSIFTKAASPPRLTKLQELQQKKEAYLRAREQAEEQVARNKAAAAAPATSSNGHSKESTSTQAPVSSSSVGNSVASNVLDQAIKSSPGCYSNWAGNHSTLASQPWCAISDLMYFCDKYEFKTLSTRDLRTHQEIVAEVRALLSGKAPFDQRTRFPGNIFDPENLWVCIGRCASVEYHLQRIASVFRKPLNQLTPDKQRTVRQNFHLAVSELRLDISARISEVRLYDRLVFEREFRLEWKDEA